MKRRLRVGLLWHTFGHPNLGVDALARANSALIRRAAAMAGIEIRFITLGTPTRPGIDVPPDVAVEVSSPDQSVAELFRKCLRYIDLGVRVALLVAVEDRTVFAFRPGQQTLALRGSDRIDLADVIPAVELTVDGLFALIRPSQPRQETP